VSLLPVALLVPAGVVAGVVGSAGGITSLISYPALLAVGVPPLPANVGNIVAAVVIGPGSALSSRRELKGTRQLLVRLLPVAALGSVAGALLLLATPPGVFARVVPFLVALGALVLLLQPTLVSWRSSDQADEGSERREGSNGGEPGLRALGVWVALISVYAGYFGAGSGVMFLAAVLFHESRVPQANAVKNVVVAATCAAAAVVLVLAAPVPWGSVVPLAAGLLVGSTLGPVLVRRMPGSAVRWLAAALGFGLATYLWLQPA
jgi:uncharacterized membrane protein YfcA